MRASSKLALAVLVSTLAFTTAARASDLILPEACGKDNVKFDVKLDKKATPPGDAPADKAQIVFVTVAGRQASTYIARVGMDGQWIGATKGDSYFAITVAPGEHHFCTSPESVMSAIRKSVGMTTFTVEAGKTYYVEYNFISAIYKSQGYGAAGGVAQGPGTPTVVATDFGLVAEDEGRYKARSTPQATSTPKK